MFTSLARWTSAAMGRPMSFVLALALSIIWLSISPMLDADLTWKGMLLTNLPTMITLLMVFLVQHTQNHHNDVVQVKLDELIRAVEGAHNVMLHLEELSPQELAKVKAKYQALAERVRVAGSDSGMATSTPYIDPSPEAPSAPEETDTNGTSSGHP